MHLFITRVTVKFKNKMISKIKTYITYRLKWVLLDKKKKAYLIQWSLENLKSSFRALDLILSCFRSSQKKQKSEEIVQRIQSRVKILSVCVSICSFIVVIISFFQHRHCVESFESYVRLFLYMVCLKCKYDGICEIWRFYPHSLS